MVKCDVCTGCITQVFFDHDNDYNIVYINYDNYNLQQNMATYSIHIVVPFLLF
jgi:hypothetical protein